jgi:hypothetical protein
LRKKGQIIPIYEIKWILLLEISVYYMEKT